MHASEINRQLREIHARLNELGPDTGEESTERDDLHRRALELAEQHADSDDAEDFPLPAWVQELSPARDATPASKDWRRPVILVPVVVVVVAGAVVLLLVTGVLGGDSAEKLTVERSFLLVDEDEFFSDSCSGTGGYGDIQSNTPVVVRDIRENVITRTELGTGEGDSSTCLFTFEFEVEEGSDGGEGFVVAVGDRGESTYSFEELKEPDTVGLVLGLD